MKPRGLSTQPAQDSVTLASGVGYGASMGSVLLCIVLWIRAKTVGEDERANAERRALFVGLWPPTLWLMADTARRAGSERRRRASRPLALGIRRRR